MNVSFPILLIAFIFVLALALMLFYQPFLTGQASFYLFDITNYYEPSLKILAEWWRQGQFMLWNPYSYCGMPQIAITEPGLFYPPNWLFAFTSFDAGLALVLLLHQLLAGTGCFLLVRSFGWGLAPSTFAGFAFALCGYMFSLQTNYTLMAAASWCPILLWLLRLLETKRGLKRSLALIAASLATALMILTGRPEIFGPAFMLLAGYIAFSFAGKFTPGNKLNAFADALLQLAALSLGLLIASAGILPAMEWLPLSPRAEGLVPADTLFWSANWYDFLCLLLMQPLGDLYLRNSPFANIALANPALEPYFASAFVGPIVITLAVPAIFESQWKPRFYLIGILVVFLVLAAGRFTPLGEYLLYAVPGVGVLRYPVKLLFFPVFCLILFAARGLYLVLENKISKRIQLTTLCMWLLVLIAGCALAYLQVPLLASEVPNAVTFLRLTFASALVLQAQQLIGQAAITMAAIGLLTSLICWLKLKNKIGALTFTISILVALCGLLMSHAFKFAYHPANPDYFNQKCYLERKLKNQGENLKGLENGSERFITMYIAGLMQPNSLETGDAVQKTIDHYQLSRQMLGVSTHFHQHYASSFGYLLSETADYRNLFVDTINKSHISGKKIIDKSGLSPKTDLPFYRFCQITSTAYCLGMIDKFTFGRFSKTGLLDANLFELLVEDPSWNARIYKVKATMPHAYLSSRWRYLDSQNEAIKKIVGAENSGFDPNQETLLDKGSLQDKPAIPEIGEDASTNGSVEFVANSPNRIVLKVKSPTTQLLVLTDRYYPGWVVYLDQKPGVILRANGMVRGIFVPAGEHVVEYSYQPKSLQLSWFIAAGACLLLMLLAIAVCFVDKRYLRLS